jgi:hypothetical protein
MLRALQEAASAEGSAQVTYVSTPQELQTALSAGALHIEITEHLDLTSLETFNSEWDGPGGLVKVEVVASTWSIKVRVFSLVMSSDWHCNLVCGVVHDNEFQKQNSLSSLTAITTVSSDEIPLSKNSLFGSFLTCECHLLALAPCSLLCSTFTHQFMMVGVERREGDKWQQSSIEVLHAKG